jgi:hypothetical protein
MPIAAAAAGSVSSATMSTIRQKPGSIDSLLPGLTADVLID